MRTAHALTVEEVVPQGSDAITLALRVDAAQASSFRFEPGQYLTLAFDVEGVTLWRCYSITSELAGLPIINVLVRRVAGGRVSNWVCDHVRPGSRIEALPPAGRFTLRGAGRPIVLFAGGSGIAPIFALAREALNRGAGKVALFYANRCHSTAMLLAELETLSQHKKGRFDMTSWYDAQNGFPSPDDVRAFALRSGVGDGDVYMCGPDLFMSTVRSGLELAHVGPEHVHQEDFGTEPDAGGLVDPGIASSLTVAIRGTEHTVPIHGGETLLSAMVKAGIEVPHACKVGECASCICHLKKGEVERLENSVLDEDDIADGLVLACRSIAASEHVMVRFS